MVKPAASPNLKLHEPPPSGPELYVAALARGSQVAVVLDSLTHAIPPDSKVRPGDIIDVYLNTRAAELAEQALEHICQLLAVRDAPHGVLQAEAYRALKYEVKEGRFQTRHTDTAAEYRYRIRMINLDALYQTFNYMDADLDPQD